DQGQADAGVVGQARDRGRSRAGVPQGGEGARHAVRLLRADDATAPSASPRERPMRGPVHVNPYSCPGSARFLFGQKATLIITNIVIVFGRDELYGSKDWAAGQGLESGRGCGAPQGVAVLPGDA